MLTLILQKLRKVRLSIPAMVLLVLASYRTLSSGDSIQLVGVCAAIVPFFCIFKNFPEAEREAGAIADVISSYLVSLILMLVYLAWILLLTWVGQKYNPGYIHNPYFTDMLFISVAADIVFLSSVIPVCRGLQPMQRMIPGLILTNAMLFFMMMASSFMKSTTLTNIPMIALGFCGLVMALTFSMILAGYKQEKA